jgi:hypothetical protein
MLASGSIFELYPYEYANQESRNMSPKMIVKSEFEGNLNLHVCVTCNYRYFLPTYLIAKGHIRIKPLKKSSRVPSRKLRIYTHEMQRRLYAFSNRYKAG